MVRRSKATLLEKIHHSGRTAFITFMARLTDNGNRLPKLQHDGLVGLGDHKQYLGNQMNARTNATAPIANELVSHSVLLLPSGSIPQVAPAAPQQAPSFPRSRPQPPTPGWRSGRSAEEGQNLAANGVLVQQNEPHIADGSPSSASMYIRSPGHAGSQLVCREYRRKAFCVTSGA